MAGVGLAALSKRFEGRTILGGIDLQVEEGELVTLLGPSGCGKTTTLRCIAGLERPDSGEIRIGERLVASPAGGVFEPPNRRGVGMVFQSYALWPHMTVFANVAYPLRVRRRDRSELKRQVMEVLAAVGMEIHAHRSVTALSGGQQQRVALARAMVAHPQVLLFDEPLSNLDAKLRAAMRREIRAVHERAGAASVYVTHDQEEAITLSDRVVVLDQGAVQQVGTPRAIYRRPVNRFVADFLGFENLLDATVVDARGPTVGVRPAGASGRLLGARPVGDEQAVVEGAPVILAVRAEDILLDLDRRDDAGPEAVTGTVVASEFVGDRVEVVVEVGDQRLRTRQREVDESAAGLRPGDRVGVRVPPDRAVVLAGRPTGHAPAGPPEGAGRSEELAFGRRQR